MKKNKSRVLYSFFFTLMFFHSSVNAESNNSFLGGLVHRSATGERMGITIFATAPSSQEPRDYVKPVGTGEIIREIASSVSPFVQMAGMNHEERNNAIASMWTNGVDITIPVVDYGFSGTLSGKDVCVVYHDYEKNHKCDQDSVTIEKYSYSVLKGNFQSSNVSGNFYIVQPWRGDASNFRLSKEEILIKGTNDLNSMMASINTYLESSRPQNPQNSKGDARDTSDGNKFILLEEYDDPLSMLSMSELMLNIVGKENLPILYKQCIHSSLSLKFEFEAIKQKIKQRGKQSKTRSIKWVNKCSQPATATCVRNSGTRTDYYYTDSARVLENLKGDCEIVVEDVDDNPFAKSLLETAQAYGGKWQASVTPEALKKIKLKGSLENLAKAEVQRQRSTEEILALSFLPKGFGTDKKLTLDLLKQDYSLFRLLNNDLKKDRGFVMKAVGINGAILQYADASLTKDKEIMKIAISSSPDTYKTINDSLKDDKELALTYVKSTPYATFKDIPRSLKKDKDIILALIKYTNGSFIDYGLTPELKRDKAFILEAVKTKPEILEKVNKSLLKDKAFVEKILKNNGQALQYVDNNLLSNKSLVLQGMNKGTDIAAFMMLPEKLKNDRDIIMAAVSSNGQILVYVPAKFHKDKEILVAAVKQAGMMPLMMVGASAFMNDEDIQKALKEFNSKK